MKVVNGVKFDPFMNYISENNPEETIKFYWRNCIAEYNFVKKEMTLITEKISEVDWSKYPNDAARFLEWMTKCNNHAVYGAPLPDQNV